MDISIKHSEMVAKLVKSPEAIMRNMTAADMNLLHSAIGISGEAGELLDYVKKIVVHNRSMDMRHIIEELGDIEFYLEQFRQEVDVSRETVLQANYDKLYARYSDFQYSDKKSKERKDIGK